MAPVNQREGAKFTNVAVKCQQMAGKQQLALLPGKPMKAPTVNGRTMVMIVQMAFKTFRDVIDLPHPSRYQRFAGIERANPAAADQYHRRRPPGPAKHRLAYLLHELGIYLPVGLIDPRNMDRTGRMPDEQIFHIGAHVDEHRVRVFLKKLECLLGAKSPNLIAGHCDSLAAPAAG
jgi:hypothetical protein